MDIGISIDTSQIEKTVDTIIREIQQASQLGFKTVWLSALGPDPLTLLALAGREVPHLEVGTGIIPTYPRHPLALATQALTVQAATGNRFVLGVGLSHQPIIENVYGYSFERPLNHMREYLSVLHPALHGQQVSFKGERLQATLQTPLRVLGARPVPILVAALGPKMLQLAGSMADGTITWLTGPKTLSTLTVPMLRQAAQDAGKPSPRVVVGMPICVTSEEKVARNDADRRFGTYGRLPSYRAMLERENAKSPAEIALVGDENAILRQLQAFADAGATDFMASPIFGTAQEQERTRSFLASLCASSDWQNNT